MFLHPGKSHAPNGRSYSTPRILTWRQMLSTMFWLIPNICNFCKEWQDWSSISKFSLENNPVSSICKYFNLDFTPFKFKSPSTFILESFRYLQPFSSTISKNSVGTHFPWRLTFCHNVSSLLMALRSDFSMKLTDSLSQILSPHSMAIGNLNKSKETKPTTTTAS